MVATPKLEVITSPGEPERTPRRGALKTAPFFPEPDEFDRLMDQEARELSAIHWTPVRVGERVAQLLELTPEERALDVGSGVGKLCVIASLKTEGCWVGVEQRAHLVRQARWLAAAKGSTAQFIHGDAFDLDWKSFDALYLYNPFDELRFPEGWMIDRLSGGHELFAAQVQRTQARLSELKSGTRVVTFHGIGGPMPETYRQQVTEVVGNGALQLWVRTP